MGKSDTPNPQPTRVWDMPYKRPVFFFSTRITTIIQNTNHLPPAEHDLPLIYGMDVTSPRLKVNVCSQTIFIKVIFNWKNTKITFLFKVFYRTAETQFVKNSLLLSEQKQKNQIFPASAQTDKQYQHLETLPAIVFNKLHKCSHRCLHISSETFLN